MIPDNAVCRPVPNFGLPCRSAVHRAWHTYPEAGRKATIPIRSAWPVLPGPRSSKRTSTMPAAISEFSNSLIVVCRAPP